MHPAIPMVKQWFWRGTLEPNSNSSSGFLFPTSIVHIADPKITFHLCIQLLVLMELGTTEVWPSLWIVGLRLVWSKCQHNCGLMGCVQTSWCQQQWFLWFCGKPQLMPSSSSELNLALCSLKPLNCCLPTALLVCSNLFPRMSSVATFPATNSAE